MLIIYTYLFNKRDIEERDFNNYEYDFFFYNKLIDLIKEYSEFKLIINYIYKFKIFKLSFILFFYIY